MTKTDQLRKDLEQQIAGNRIEQDTLMEDIADLECELIALEDKHDRLLDQLAELDGNDLAKQEETEPEEHTETIGRLFLDVNEQGNTIQ